jgi:hypothetical protein
MDEGGQLATQAETHAELERLARQLRARDQSERLDAVSGLAALGTPEAVAALALSLERPDALVVTQAVVQALADAARCDRAVVEELCRQAESDAARACVGDALAIADRPSAPPVDAARAAPAAEAPGVADGRGRVARAQLPAVPWGLRESLLGTVIAMFPVAVPVLVNWIAGLTTTVAATTAVAVAVVVSQLLHDGWWLVWAWVFSLRKFKLRLSAWGFRRPRLSILWLVPLVVVAYAVVGGINGGLLHPHQQALTTHFPHTVMGLVLFALSACVLAPLFEETFFRGFLFQGLGSWRGPLLAALLSSALWSIGHQQLIIFMPIFILGLLMCWAFKRSGSLWTTMPST